MCVSKTLVAIKQGEFPGGRVLGDTGNRQDAGPHPTHTMHFFHAQHSQKVKQICFKAFSWWYSINPISNQKKIADIVQCASQ